MRLIGWILFFSGGWSLWKALADGETLGLGGALMMLSGVALLASRGRALAAWVGGGLLTGLCLAAGAGFLGVGGLALLTYLQVLVAGIPLPVESVVVPVLFLGWGLCLVVLAVTRLLRQYRAL